MKYYMLTDVDVIVLEFYILECYYSVYVLDNDEWLKMSREFCIKHVVVQYSIELYTSFYSDQWFIYFYKYFAFNI